MYQVRDYSIFLPSPNAKRAFARLRVLDFAINGLIALMIPVAIWNIWKLVQLRAIQHQDFAAITDLRHDLSTRLIWGLAAITLVLVLTREWMSGDHTMGVIYPLGALLFLAILPTAMAEMQPRLIDHTMQIVMRECPPKTVVNGTLTSVVGCKPLAVDDGDILLATSNPVDGQFATIDAVGGGQNTMTFHVAGRGTYTVYFMFQQDSMASCQQELIFPNWGSLADASRTCMEYAGATWLVMPHTTSGYDISTISLVRVGNP